MQKLVGEQTLTLHALCVEDVNKPRTRRLVAYGSIKDSVVICYINKESIVFGFPLDSDSVKDDFDYVKDEKLYTISPCSFMIHVYAEPALPTCYYMLDPITNEYRVRNAEAKRHVSKVFEPTTANALPFQIRALTQKQITDDGEIQRFAKPAPFTNPEEYCAITLNTPLSDDVQAGVTSK